MLSTLLLPSAASPSGPQATLQAATGPSCISHPLGFPTQTDNEASYVAADVWYAHGSFGDDTFTRCNQWGDLYNCGEFLPTPMLECESGGHGPNDAFTHTWLIGPFTSTGGYDWFDVEFKTNLSPRHQAVGAFSFSFHEGVPSADGPPGAQLGLPPIHNHHSTLAETGLDGAEFRIQGDSLCFEGDPFACQSRDLEKLGYMQPLLSKSREVRLNSLFNDVRPVNSSRMTWYFNLTLSFVAPAAVAARTLTPIGEFLAKHHSAADSFFYTVDVPMHNDSFIAFEVRPTRSGTLLADPSIIRHHSHVHNFHSSFLVKASAAELGLDDPRFYAASACDARETRDAGFRSNEKMLNYLVGRCPSCFSLTAPNTKLMCRANSSIAEVGGKGYDRMAKVDCSASLIPFRRGDVFTSISFLGPHHGVEFYPMPSMYGSSRIVDDETHEVIELRPRAEGYFPMHTNWWLYYLPSALDEPVAEQLNGDVLSRGPFDADHCV